MRVVTANIKHTMPRRKRVHDIEKVAHLGDVILWQEIEVQSSKIAVDRVFRNTYGLHREEPISTNAAIRQQHYRLMHHGRRLTTPNRYVEVVEAIEGGLPVAYMNTHYVSGAWNRRLKLHKKWRKQMWWVHYRKQRAWVHELLGQGYTVVGGADFNRDTHTIPLFHPRQQWLAEHHIDGIFIIPADGVTVQHHGTHKVPAKAARRGGLFTDHPALVAEVSIHQHAGVKR